MLLVGTKEVGLAKFGSPGGNVAGGSLVGGGGANCPWLKPPVVTGACGN